MGTRSMEKINLVFNICHNEKGNGVEDRKGRD